MAEERPMFLDQEWRGEGEPQTPRQPRVSNLKIALVSTLIPVFMFFGMLGFYSVQMGYILGGSACIGVAILVFQQFISRGIDVVFSLRRDRREID